MARFLASGPVRAGVFFAGGLSVTIIAGTLIGVPRLGLRIGVLAGLTLAAFGWLFVRPAEPE